MRCACALSRIVEALFFNKRARMSSVNRGGGVVRAQRRALGRASPGLTNIVSAIGRNPEATDGAVHRRALPAALTAAEAASVTDEESGQSEELFDEELPPEEKQRAAGMSLSSSTSSRSSRRSGWATVGNAYCRKMLVRDANRLVAMAVIRSPQITGMEIQRIAGSTNVCDRREFATSRTAVTAARTTA